MTLGVLDELRGLQIGQKLMDAVELASNNRVDSIELHVVEYNHGARRFYQRLGFIELETINDHYEIYGKQYPGVLMTKKIKRKKPWWSFLFWSILQNLILK